MEPKALKQPCKHSQLNINEKDLNKKSKDTQQNQKASNQLPSSQHTRSSQLSNINDAKWDFTKIPLLSQENSMFNSRVNQEYLKNYYKLTFIYYVDYENDSYTFVIYNTKKEREIKVTMQENNGLIYPGACLVELPNRGIFCFGSKPRSHNDAPTFLIDLDCNFHELPTSGYIWDSSAIYYNRSVYCFGGMTGCDYFNCDYGGFRSLDSCYRFDLDKMKWVWLYISLPEPAICETVIFNGNILISQYKGYNLWIYSIDFNSFSVIPYWFKPETTKIMINTGERLYLIESDDHWIIYESDVGDVYTWNILQSLENISTSHGEVRSCLYNKEKESIYILSKKNQSRCYYKFNLDGKVLKKSKKCIIF